MTRKDYILIADAFQMTVNALKDNERMLRPDIQETGIYRVAVTLCSLLKDNNPRFNSDKFMRACGL
jgi:hypothetical protein